MGDAVVDKACHMITGLCQQVDLAFDMAFSAGTLSSGLVGLEGESVPTIDSVQYHSNFTEDMRKYALKRAKTKLYDAIDQFKMLDEKEYPDTRDPDIDNVAFEHWLRNDTYLQEKSYEFFTEIRDKIRQSLELTEKKEKKEKATTADIENSFERLLKSRIDDLTSENTNFWNFLEELEHSERLLKSRINDLTSENTNFQSTIDV